MHTHTLEAIIFISYIFSVSHALDEALVSGAASILITRMATEPDTLQGT
jgi:hypothetical protein